MLIKEQENKLNDTIETYRKELLVKLNSTKETSEFSSTEASFAKQLALLKEKIESVYEKWDPISTNVEELEIEKALKQINQHCDELKELRSARNETIYKHSFKNRFMRFKSNINVLETKKFGQLVYENTLNGNVAKGILLDLSVCFL